MKGPVTGGEVILGVTPARGGSKGVARKNIRLLAGKPLIAWTIEAALGSKRLDRYLVSTEDSEIAHVAKDYGAQVIDRPKELATDEATTGDVLRHALTLVEADVVVLLQATSPVRDADLIDHCIERFLRTHPDSLATGFICRATEYGKNSLRRQEIPGFFYNDGNVAIFWAHLIRQGEFYGKRYEKILLDREQNVEIDDEFDFWLAEKVMERRLAQVPR